MSLQMRKSLPKHNYCWRFNPLLLTDQDFNNFTTQRINEFVETNDNGEVSDSILWESFKVVMQGHIKSFEASKKKEQCKRLEEIKNVLPGNEESSRNSMSQVDYNKILNLKSGYNNILSGKVNNLLLKLKQKHFELGDKPEKLLARQRKGAQASHSIHKIKSERGTLLTNPKETNNCFKEFYSDLYTTKSKATNSDFSKFFDSLKLPKLNEASRKDLDSTISLSELVEALKASPSGKSAGPDG